MTSPDPSASPPLRAILFDAGNTLVFADHARLLDLFEAEGVVSDEGRVHAAELVARSELTARIEEGAVGTEPHLWKGYFQTLFRGSGVPEERLEAVGRRLREAHAREHLWTRVEPDLSITLEALLDQGVRLAVISNADGRMEQALERAGVRRYLEFVVDSGLVGVEKPDPAIFSLGLDRLGVPAREALYVGDLYPVDVVGARRVGMGAVLLDPGDTQGDRPVDRLPSVTHLPRWLASRP